MSAWWHWGGLFAAGGLGACLRHVLALRIDASLGAGLPYAGTLAVNLLGCLAIGALAAWLSPGPVRTIVLAGLLGGFTTYSTFALLTVEHAGSGRWNPLSWQLGLHLFGGALLAAIGAALVGLLSRPA